MDSNRDSTRLSVLPLRTGAVDREPLLQQATQPEYGAKSSQQRESNDPNDPQVRLRWEEAAQRRAECLRNWCSESPFRPTPLTSSVLGTGDAGVGLALFFHHVKEYAIAFGLFSILALVCLIEYGGGNGPELDGEDYASVNDDPPSLVKISITNLGDERPSSAILVMDLIFSIFLLIFIYFQKYYEQERILNMKNFKFTAPYYTVEIRGLPKLSYKEQELSEFFSKYGKVHKTTIVSLPPDLIELRTKRTIARQYLDHALAAEAANCPDPWYYEYLGIAGRTSQSLSRRRLFQPFGIGRDSLYWTRYLSDIELLITEAEAKKPDPIGRAFVTFEEVESAVKCKEVYMGSRLARTCQLIWCYSGPPKFRYRSVEALDPPEPLDIIWENLGHGNFSRFVRQLGTFVICFGLIGISLIVNSAILENEKTPNEGFPLAVALIVGFLNYALTAFLCSVVPLERHHSHTGLQTGLCAKIFFVTILNSSLSVALAVLLSIQGKVDKEGEIQLEDVYKVPDFVEGYVLVVIAVILGPVIRRLSMPVFYQYKVKKMLPFCFTRKDYDEAYRNPPFNLAEAYAFTLEVIFICLALSPIAPIVIIIGFLGLVLHYWVCKYTVLRVSGPPPPYEVKLALRLERLLPSCITIHMIVASICYSTQGIEYEGSVMESVFDLSFFSRAFESGDETQDHILVFYWIFTAILVFVHFIVPFTPIYWIFAYFKIVGREQMVITNKLLKMNPMSFAEALQTGQASLYDPPVGQDDAEEDRGVKVERYLQRTLTRLQGVVRWLPENSLDAEELWNREIS